MRGNLKENAVQTLCSNAYDILAFSNACDIVTANVISNVCNIFRARTLVDTLAPFSTSKRTETVQIQGQSEMRNQLGKAFIPCTKPELQNAITQTAGETSTTEIPQSRNARTHGHLRVTFFFFFSRDI